MIRVLIISFIFISLYSGYVETDRGLYNIESIATLFLLSIISFKVSNGFWEGISMICFFMSLVLFYFWNSIDKMLLHYDIFSQFLGFNLSYIIFINTEGFDRKISFVILVLVLFELIDEIRNVNNKIVYWGDLLLNIAGLYYLLCHKSKQRY